MGPQRHGAGQPLATDRQAITTSAADARAATLAAAHDSTPTVSLTDALGRVVRTRADNGAAGTTRPCCTSASRVTYRPSTTPSAGGSSGRPRRHGASAGDHLR